MEELLQYRQIYVATPYSKFPDGLISAFEEACRLTGRLLMKGLRVYSPIAHSHPIAWHAEIDPLDYKIWLPSNEFQISVSDCLLVCQMRGWDKSFGIGEEIKAFLSANKPIRYMDPDTLAYGPTPVVMATRP